MQCRPGQRHPLMVPGARTIRQAAKGRAGQTAGKFRPNAAVNRFIIAQARRPFASARSQRAHACPAAIGSRFSCSVCNRQPLALALSAFLPQPRERVDDDRGLDCVASCATGTSCAVPLSATGVKALASTNSMRAICCLYHDFRNSTQRVEFRFRGCLPRTSGATLAIRTPNILLTSVVVMLAVIALQPYIEHHFYAATATRAIEPRGTLADFERSSIAVFERVSPSVVQVVGRGEEQALGGGEETGIRTGTGFVWDGAGDIVTNNHVVEGTRVLAVRLASGDAVKRNRGRHRSELRPCSHPRDGIKPAACDRGRQFGR
jgi:hypothetical protein